MATAGTTPRAAERPVSDNAELVREGITRGERRRRTREAGLHFWLVAPVVAAVSLCVAAASRWAGLSPLLPGTVLAVGVLGLVAYVFASRRVHQISDSVAARIDADAGLGGELRSANWFATREARDAWADFHIDRAAARLQAIDWTQLYPAARAPRARLATAVMAISAVLLALTFPDRTGLGSYPSVTASASSTTRGGILVDADKLPPELRKQLEDLLAAAETGTIPTDEAAANASELRELLTQLGQLRDSRLLEDLAREAGASGRAGETAEDMKALAEWAKRAAEMAAGSLEVRDALEDLAESLKEAAKTSLTASEEPGDTFSSRDAQQGKAGQAKAATEELSIQFVKEAEARGGAGVIMMSEQDASKGAPPGFGVGGSGSENALGKMTDIHQALRQETVEASADSPGDNVLADVRRKTEQGRATVTFSRDAAGTFDTSRATAPPPVPEARRAGVGAYFIRKQ